MSVSFSFLRSLRVAVLGSASILAVSCALADPVPVEIKAVEGKVQFDVSVGGKPFTSYVADEQKQFHKPIFYPILTTTGAQINRSIPPIKGEATDHPHHQSLWFNYGSVNGIDYWNLKSSGRRIKHREAAIDGHALKLTLDWIDNDSKLILVEKRTVNFGGAEGVRWMDHDITLTATDAPVAFGDSKEGAFAIRVAGRLQETGGTGKYINAEGLEMAKGVWGKPSAWVAQRGSVFNAAGGDEPLTLALYVHPQTHNFPPYWHARDYGLFALNPWGRHEYDKTQEPRSETLEPGKSFKVRVKVVIYDGIIEKPRLDGDYAEFSK